MDIESFLRDWRDSEPTMTVKTSGSTGVPKLLTVEKARMAASARATCQFLGISEGNSALLCMPLDYIAGKMMVVRAEVCGLHLTAVEPSLRPLRPLVDNTDDFDLVAMVPSQVSETLRHPAEKKLLQRCRHLLVGGGAVSQELAEELLSFPYAVWNTYGMTETLSNIAMRRLSGAGASEWFTPLPGVEVTVNADSCLVIDAPHVCPSRLTTNDIGEMRGREFRVLGRRDNTICSGGIKIQMEAVEAVLSPRLSSAFAITKAADETFGEVVAMVTESSDIDIIRQLCQELLPRYHRPKHIIHVDRVPLTETGKTARADVERVVREALSS